MEWWEENRIIKIGGAPVMPTAVSSSVSSSCDWDYLSGVSYTSLISPSGKFGASGSRTCKRKVCT